MGNKRFPIPERKEEFAVSVRVVYEGETVETIHVFKRPSRFYIEGYLKGTSAFCTYDSIYSTCLKSVEGYDLPENAYNSLREYIPDEHQKEAVRGLMEQLESETIEDKAKAPIGKIGSLVSQGFKERCSGRHLRLVKS